MVTVVDDDFRRRFRARYCSLIATVVFAAALLAGPAAAGDDDDDRESVAAVVEIVDGRTRLRFEPDALTRFGIELAAPTPYRQTPETHVFGEVLDTASLLDLVLVLEQTRAAHASAAELVSTQRALLAGLDEMRAQGLAVNAITLARERREMNRLRAEQRSAELAVAAAVRRIRHTWGAALGDLASGGNEDAVIGELLASQSQIVNVPVREAPSVSQPAFVARSGVRSDALPAVWSGIAPRSRSALGTNYLLLTRDPGLRAGMRVSVWLSATGEPVDGFTVPRGALVWHAGARWIYVELAAGVFERRPADVLASADDVTVIRARAGTPGRVVVTGAPSLLGEEFRWSIPDEDDD